MSPVWPSKPDRHLEPGSRHARDRHQPRVHPIAQDRAVRSYREITLRRPKIPVNAGNVEAVAAARHLDLRAVNRLAPDELARLKEFASKVDRQKVVECAKRYPGKTALRLLESEANGVLA